MEISDLKDLERGSLDRGIPILGWEKGTWLYNEVQTKKPVKILELGTANGYSGIILGSAGGKLITVEQDVKLVEEARNNFRKFGVDAKVFSGDCVEFVDNLVKDVEVLRSFDLVFIDFAKKDYMKVLGNCMKLVKKGGWIIADNINFEKCADFKRAVLRYAGLDTIIIEIRDGLSCSEVI